MPDELIISEQVVTSEVIATGTLPEGKVDLAPDPTALQADIDRLKEVRDKAKTDSEYWRRQKAEARADYFRSRKPDEPPPPPPPSDQNAPRKEDFDDYDKFMEAKISHEVKKARTQWDVDVEKKSSETVHQQRMTGLQAKIQEGIRKYPDFEEVAMAPEVPITPVIVDILAESEIAHDVAYYLGKNRAEAIRISHMTPIQAARAIAKIEVEIAKAGNPPPQNPNPPKITNAPPPITPVGSANPVAKDPEKMSPKEFEDWLFNQQKVKRF
jgi:hypothetical protein